MARADAVGRASRNDVSTGRGGRVQEARNRDSKHIGREVWNVVSAIDNLSQQTEDVLKCSFLNKTKRNPWL